MSVKGKSQLQPALHRTQIELDKLPAKAIVIDRFGDAWQQGGMRLAFYWYRAFGDGEHETSFDLAQRAPLSFCSPEATPLDRRQSRK